MLLKRESVSNKLILRRGVVGNDCDGTPLLINGRGEAYRVNDTAVSLWNMCNGITFDDLVLEVLRISSGGEDDVAGRYTVAPIWIKVVGFLWHKLVLDRKSILF